ncbi:MAG: glycoside hydrolase family 15 protein [Acidobacteriota bacterium]|nr:glycoside hydrolase family 15 protein [Acidobacteriota bacterium]
MPYKPIADYAIIGCTRSAALISRDGSIDWLCWPRFDSPSIFARILDHQKGGCFSISPAGEFKSQRRYLDGTNVLETTFEVDGGIVKLIDLMPVMREEDKLHRLTPFRQLLRRVECLEGEVAMEVHFSPRTNYARSRVNLRYRRDSIICEQLPIALHLRSDIRFELDSADAFARFTIRKGERHDFALAFEDRSPAVMPHIGDEATQEIERSVAFWREWSSHCTYDGPYRAQVLRSVLLLKLLTYAPSGAIVAAPTTSLPEKIGGVRNWDYRFCWLRDAAFTVSALDDCGFTIEGGAFLDWMLYATRLTHPRLQILYDVFGEPHVPETILDHLEGYEHSGPVRIGNDAHDQVQLDIYGEVLAAVEAHLDPDAGKLYRDVRTLLSRLADRVVEKWKEPDSGIWEKRSGRQQHVHGKVMAWAALDCAERLAKKKYIPDRRVDVWRRAKEEIRATILDRGFNRELGSFVSLLDGDELDASLLYLSRIGFLEPTDPRIVATIDAIRQQLGHDELLYRYELTTEDGLPPGEGAFVACSFWLVEALALAGRIDEAHATFEKLLHRCNDLGLYSEEVDVASGALLGNFPQALTHIGLINAALCLLRTHTTT